MKKHTLLTGLSVLALSSGCGSQSSADHKEDQDPNGIALSLVDRTQINTPENIMDCKSLTKESLICAFKPNVSLVDALQDNEPALVTFKYTLACVGETKGALSDIAIRSDAQVRRLQYNVEDREISILSKAGAHVSLAKVVAKDATEALKGASNCWFFKIDHVRTENLLKPGTQDPGTEENPEDSGQQEGGLDDSGQQTGS